METGCASCRVPRCFFSMASVSARIRKPIVKKVVDPSTCRHRRGDRGQVLRFKSQQHPTRYPETAQHMAGRDYITLHCSRDAGWLNPDCIARSPWPQREILGRGNENDMGELNPQPRVPCNGGKPVCVQRPPNHAPQIWCCTLGRLPRFIHNNLSISASVSAGSRGPSIIVDPRQLGL